MPDTVRFALLVAGSLALASAGFAGNDTSIEGKVNYQGQPLKGARVSLYDSAEKGFRGPPVYRSEATPEDGSFRVDVRPGTYFLVAHKLAGEGPERELAPGDHFAFYGGNPVVVPEGETIHIGINASPLVAAAEKSLPGGTGIRGTVYADGEPLAQARVVLYQDASTIFRGIGYASVVTNAQGQFTINLEPGNYFVVARKRVGEDRLGPLETGDLFAFAHENPIGVTEGSFTVIAMNAVTKLTKVKEGGQEVTLGGTVKSGETVIEGRVLDPQGKPVPGVFVGAYRDSMMIYKPDFISNRTGPDGTYRVHLSEGGEYFLIARDTMGGPAEKGDRLGRYAGNEDHSVTLETGHKAEGIDITVEVVE